MKVLPEQACNGCSKLTLADWRNAGPLTQRWGVGTNNGDPITFRAFDLFTVVTPGFRPAPASMVGGENKGRFVSILAHVLCRNPEPSHEVINMMSCRQVKIVPASVRPFVGFSETKEDDARVFALHMARGGMKKEGIVGQVVPNWSCVSNHISNNL